MEAVVEITAAVKNVPALRFQEFEGEWVKLKLDEVAEKIQDGTHFSPTLQEEGNYKYITSKNIRNGYMDLTDVPYLSDEAHRGIYSRCDIKYKDVLLTKDGSATGTVCLNELDEEFSLLSSVAFIRADKSKATNEFIYQYIAGPKGQNEIKSSIAGQAITRITLSKLRNFKFYYPSLPEQQKIASFLGSVDLKIEQLSQKKALLEKYKKGVMQRLFQLSELGLGGLKDERISEGEGASEAGAESILKSTHPKNPNSDRLRFKDDNGNHFPEWEVKRLGEVGKTYNGLTGKTKENFGEGKPYIQYKQIFDNSRIDISRCDLVDVGDNERQSRVIYGDIFFTVSSETPNEIGMASVLLDEVEELYLNSFCFGYRPDSFQILNPHFARYLFRSSSFRKDIIKLAQGSTRYNMSKVELMKIKVGLPCLEEQTKIANFLTSLDKKISYTSEALEQARAFKKGLLQQLFV